MTIKQACTLLLDAFDDDPDITAETAEDILMELAEFVDEEGGFIALTFAKEATR